MQIPWIVRTREDYSVRVRKHTYHQVMVLLYRCRAVSNDCWAGRTDPHSQWSRHFGWRLRAVGPRCARGEPVDWRTISEVDLQLCNGYKCECYFATTEAMEAHKEKVNCGHSEAETEKVCEMLV